MALVRRETRSQDGIPIVYDDVGTGNPALVLVHGWSCDRTYWNSVVPRLAERSRLVAVDLAGHGESGAGRSDWTMRSFGEDVLAVVDDGGFDDVVLIGHSMGGDVVVDAAVLLGDRVRGIVWVDTYRSLGEQRTPDEVASFVARLQADFTAETVKLVKERLFPPGSDPTLVDWVASDMSAAPPEIAVSAMRHSISNDGPILGYLERLGVPFVAINPAESTTDQASLRRYGIRTIELPGAGHFPMLEDPPGFTQQSLASSITSMLSVDHDRRRTPNERPSRAGWRVLVNSASRR